MSETGNRVTVKQDIDFVPLALEQRLTELSSLEVRYSRGFMCADIETYFNGLAEHWKPFFLSVGAELQVSAIRKHLHFPQELGRIVVVEIGGESAVFGIDEISQETLARSVAMEAGASASDVLVEYLERRLLTTLTKSWAGKDPVQFLYLSSDWAEEVEILGAVELELLVDDQKTTVWIGLGPRAMDEIDRQWRQRIGREETGHDRAAYGDSVHLLAVEIAQLSVPPAMLIDYMRAGSIIDLELPVSDTVTLVRNGEAWAAGVLRQFNGSFAVEITDLSPPEFEYVDGTTRVEVELARVELDETAIHEYRQVGAILPTSKQVGSITSLIINGEHVAQALLGEVDGNLTLSVLPK